MEVWSWPITLLMATSTGEHCFLHGRVAPVGK